MSEADDERKRRIQALKQAVGGLRPSASLDGVRDWLQALVGECDASEVAAMEQELIAEGTTVGQASRMCDLHSQAVREVLAKRSPLDVEAGHPWDTFRRENAALRGQAARLRTCLAELGKGPDEELVPAPQVEAARSAYGLLMDVDKHYLRKEHLLFPILEKRGITGPSKVMWAKDDEVRSLLKDLGEVVGMDGTTRAVWRLAAAAVAEPALGALEEMVFKEESILLPLSLQALTEDDWADVAAQSPRIGYCMVDPPEGGRPR
jgi:DUF438 domain-containing protein